MSLSCSKCGSERIVPDAHLHEGYADSLRLSVYYPHPRGDGYDPIQASTPVALARVCADCGFIEFIARDPESLYRAYRRAHP